MFTVCGGRTSGVSIQLTPKMFSSKIKNYVIHTRNRDMFKACVKQIQSNDLSACNKTNAQIMPMKLPTPSITNWTQFTDWQSSRICAALDIETHCAFNLLSANHQRMPPHIDLDAQKCVYTATMKRWFFRWKKITESKQSTIAFTGLSSTYQMYMLNRNCGFGIYRIGFMFVNGERVDHHVDWIVTLKRVG